MDDWFNFHSLLFFFFDRGQKSKASKTEYEVRCPVSVSVNGGISMDDSSLLISSSLALTISSPFLSCSSEYQCYNNAISPPSPPHPQRRPLHTPPLSLKTRCLMLALQPITLLTYGIEHITSRKFPHDTEIQIPLRNGESVRAVVYIPPPQPNLHSSPSREEKKKVPIHLNIHGGAFLGGLPEGNARFYHSLSQTGVLVISSAYRYAPVHTFPEAHEVVLDIAKWIFEFAEGVWDADVGTFTVSGFSVGGNLVLGLAQQFLDDAGTSRVKGLVSLEGVVDFRLPPSLKPKPEGYPKYDPLLFLMPLFDTYAGPIRIRDLEDPLLHPTLADIEALPRNMFLLLGGMLFCLLRRRGLLRGW
ncbi:Alpha/Beta hydrolase protein [Aspergillus venezuelensis]